MKNPKSKAESLFKRMSENVPAYKKIIDKAGIESFDDAPVLTKENYVKQNNYRDLVFDGDISNIAYIASSSGSTGEPTYWLRGFKQDKITYSIESRLFDLFPKGSKLIINCFAQGRPLAGLELYNSVVMANNEGKKIAVINNGIYIENAIDQIQKFKDVFDMIIVAGYPPLIKDLLDEAKNVTDLNQIKLGIYVAGEAISEEWRDYVQSIFTSKNETRLFNFYGMADVGVIGNENRLTVKLRKLAQKNEEINQLIGGSGAACLYEYNPMTHYIEVGNNGDLLLTVEGGIPLCRYDSKDRGGIVSVSDLKKILDKYKISYKGELLPLVYLYGRSDLSATIYALLVYPDQIKMILDGLKLHDRITGKFTMKTIYDNKFDQKIHIKVESIDKKTDKKLQELIEEKIGIELPKLNYEFKELKSKLGDKAYINVEIVERGKIGYEPGKKHKWVVKD